jgi:hypothetical protein
MLDCYEIIKYTCLKNNLGLDISNIIIEKLLILERKEKLKIISDVIKTNIHYIECGFCLTNSDCIEASKIIWAKKSLDLDPILFFNAKTLHFSNLKLLDSKRLYITLEECPDWKNRNWERSRGAIYKKHSGFFAKYY